MKFIRAFKLFFYILSIFFITTIGYKIYKKGNTQIISLKPEMTRYCKSNNYYTSYDRINCLKTLTGEKLNPISIENQTRMHIEEFKKVHIEHNENYLREKVQKQIANDKIKQLHTLYMFHQMNPINQF